MATLSKAEYLKKYLTGSGNADHPTKKKKKVKKSKGIAGMSIVEEDAFQVVSSGARPDIDSDMEEEIQIEAEIKKKVDETKAKFRVAFSAVDEKPVKKEPLSSPESSPPRRQRRDSVDSPSRGSASPRRRQRRDSDNSPPRALVSSPVRRKRRDSDSSPPRKQRRASPLPEPSRRRRDSDASPPRRRRRDSDESPPRRRARQDSDESPPRRKTRRSASRDLSPPRRGNGASAGRREIVEPVIKKEVKEEPVDVYAAVEEPQARQTLDGKRAGLSSASQLTLEMEEKKRKEIERFTQMAADISGQGAATVVRSKQYGRNKGKDEDKEKKEREAAKTAELAGKYKDYWNKGVAQIEERSAKLDEMARVAAEPWERKKDDEAMNESQRAEMMRDDPLANYVRKKRRTDNIREGRVVYPQYEGPWPPNRFSIAPGYRWDGVVRGTGFEGKLALSANAKKASEAEYYQNVQTYE